MMTALISNEAHLLVGCSRTDEPPCLYKQVYKAEQPYPPSNAFSEDHTSTRGRSTTFLVC